MIRKKTKNDVILESQKQNKKNKETKASNILQG